MHRSSIPEVLCRSLFVAMVASSMSACAFTQPEASLLLVGGKIWTGDARSPSASAIAILDGRIVFVGDDFGASLWRGPSTREIDLAGRRVVPGFIDSHVHFVDGGEEILAPDLRSARSEEDFAERVAASARELPVGSWITAGSWDHENWPGARLPTRAALDRHVPVLAPVRNRVILPVSRGSGR